MLRCAIAVAVIVAAARGRHAVAQSRPDFAALLRQATELPPDRAVTRLLAPFVDACRRDNEFEERRCQQALPGLRASVLQGLWRVDLNASQLVTVLPYDFAQHRFRMTVSGINLRHDIAGDPGITGPNYEYFLSTHRTPTAAGSQTLADQFIPMPNDAAAEAWRDRNIDEARLTVTVLFRAADAWSETLRCRGDSICIERRGLVMRVAGIQVRNHVTGEVLLESVTAPPPAAVTVAPFDGGSTVHAPTTSAPVGFVARDAPNTSDAGQPDVVVAVVPAPRVVIPVVTATLVTPRLLFNEDFRTVPIGTPPASLGPGAANWVVVVAPGGTRFIQCGRDGTGDPFRLRVAALPEEWRFEIQITVQGAGPVNVTVGAIEATFSDADLPTGRPLTLAIERRNGTCRNLLDGRVVGVNTADCFVAIGQPVTIEVLPGFNSNCQPGWQNLVHRITVVGL